MYFSITKRMIWVTFQREGYHSYPAAATDIKLMDVSYLANKHRHIFHFHVGIGVDHNERDIEFIQFKHFCEGVVDNRIIKNLDADSCETMAEKLIYSVWESYPFRKVDVTVSEDGENGCTLTTDAIKD